MKPAEGMAADSSSLEHSERVKEKREVVCTMWLVREEGVVRCDAKFFSSKICDLLALALPTSHAELCKRNLASPKETKNTC
jgi:hypothetical protein